MRVIDSKQIFAGQGLLAAHTQKLIDEDRYSKNQPVSRWMPLPTQSTPA